MASAICPYCEAVNVSFPNDFADRVQCSRCPKLFFLEIRNGRARTVLPADVVIDPPPDLDPQLAADLREAVTCFNVQAYRATVVMSRRFLEAFLDSRGFKAPTLAGRVKLAHEGGKIPELVYQLVTTTRILGNYGAHYIDDELKQIGADEAELVLNMLKQILKRGAGSDHGV